MAATKLRPYQYLVFLNNNEFPEPGGEATGNSTFSDVNIYEEGADPSVTPNSFVETETEHYVYSGDQLALTLSDDAQLKHRYTYAPGTDNLLVDEVFDEMGQLDQSLWAVTDRQGTVHDLLDGTNHNLIEHREYDAFGAIDQVFDEMGAAKASSGLKSDFGFAGRAWDDKAALYYNRARWYEPESGRFISEDPAEDGSNWYAYADNNPVNYVDPSGLSVQSPLNNLFGPSASSSFGINSGPVTTPSSPSISFGLGANTLANTSSFDFSTFDTPSLSTPISLGVSNFNNVLNRPQASPVSPAGPVEYFNRYDSDVIFRNRIDEFDSLRRAQRDINSDSPFRAFSGQLATSLNAMTGDFVPGGGEFQDAQVLFGQDSSLGQRIIAGTSLAVSLVTLGSSPNAGSALRSSVLDTHTLDDLLDAQRFTQQIDVLPNSQVLGQSDTIVRADLPEGIVYLRSDITGNVLPYGGQSVSYRRFLERQREHARRFPDADFDFQIITRAEPGIALDVAEHQFIQELTGGVRARKSPLVSNQNDPVGSLRRPTLGLPEPRNR